MFSFLNIIQSEGSKKISLVLAKQQQQQHQCHQLCHHRPSPSFGVTITHWMKEFVVYMVVDIIHTLKYCQVIARSSTILSSIRWPVMHNFSSQIVNLMNMIESNTDVTGAWTKWSCCAIDLLNPHHHYRLHNWSNSLCSISHFLFFIRNCRSVEPSKVLKNRPIRVLKIS